MARNALTLTQKRSPGLTTGRYGVLRSVKEWDAAGDGSTDDTQALQTACDQWPFLYFPAGSYRINAVSNNPDDLYDGGVKPMNGSRWVLHPKAIVRALATDRGAYVVVNCTDVTDFIIEGGTLAGERNEHTGADGEWGFPLFLRRAKRIVARDVALADSWGDGCLIYGGARWGDPPSEDIVLDNVRATNNRRNGLAITNARRVKIAGGCYELTGGTAPAVGIDLEPDRADNYLDSIELINVTTRSNQNGGLLIVPDRLGIFLDRVGLTTPNPVSIKIANFTSIDDGNSGGISAAYGGILFHVDSAANKCREWLTTYWKEGDEIYLAQSVRLAQPLETSKKYFVRNPEFDPEDGRTVAWQLSETPDGPVITLLDDGERYDPPNGKWGFHAMMSWQHRIPGAIHVANACVNDARRSGVQIYRWCANAPRMVLTSITVTDPNTDNHQTNNWERCGFVIRNNITDFATESGLVELMDCRAVDTRETPRMLLGFYLRDETFGKKPIQAILRNPQTVNQLAEGSGHVNWSNGDGAIAYDRPPVYMPTGQVGLLTREGNLIEPDPPGPSLVLDLPIASWLKCAWYLVRNAHGKNIHLRPKPGESIQLRGLAAGEDLVLRRPDEVVLVRSNGTDGWYVLGHENGMFPSGRGPRVPREWLWNDGDVQGDAGAILFGDGGAGPSWRFTLGTKVRTVVDISDTAVTRVSGERFDRVAWTGFSLVLSDGTAHKVGSVQDQDHLTLETGAGERNGEPVWIDRIAPRFRVYATGQVEQCDQTGLVRTSILSSGELRPMGVGNAILAGTDSPEGSIQAALGSLYLRRDASAAHSLYIKETGDGSHTGWVAVQPNPAKAKLRIAWD